MNKSPVSYVTKGILTRIRSLETDTFRFNEFLSDDYIDGLDPTVKLPVVEAHAHRQEGSPYEDFMRCLIILPVHGRHTRAADELRQGVIDMPLDVYRSLPAA
jgi:hypothetical protein